MGTFFADVGQNGAEQIGRIRANFGRPEAEVCRTWSKLAPNRSNSAHLVSIPSQIGRCCSTSCQDWARLTRSRSVQVRQNSTENWENGRVDRVLPDLGKRRPAFRDVACPCSERELSNVANACLHLPDLFVLSLSHPIRGGVRQLLKAQTGPTSSVDAHLHQQTHAWLNWMTMMMHALGTTPGHTRKAGKEHG